MPEQPDRAEVAALRKDFEDLAMRVMLADSPADYLRLAEDAEVASLLARLSGSAERAGIPGAAGLFAGLRDALAGPAKRRPALCEKAFREGLARLEQWLERAVEPREESLPAAGPPAAGANPLAQDPELMADFCVESREHLASIETQSLRLEEDPSDREAIHSVFRSFHTIKGLAGFLDLSAVRDVAHEIETVLDLARNAQLAIDSGVIDIVLAGKDYLGQWLERLEAVQAGLPARAVAPAGEFVERVRRLHVRRAAAPGSAPPKTKVESRFVKVDTAKLDHLVDMVGEMVIAQSLIRHDSDFDMAARPRLARNIGQLTRITDEVQKAAMSMRMVPIRQLFQKMSRLVRDLAHKSGKEIALETAGEETELDRNIVEELADPLMHMVRNSVDHGFETPAERRAAGKDPQGRLSLTARHQAGRILLEVADDGRGLNTERILAKARERGLIDEGAQLSDNETFNLIFHPGFTTAERVTDVSGRGVGMDVVRRQIAKLRGRIDISSAPGRGTKFSLRLPLTLAIIDGLVVTVGRERFIAPIAGVREVMRPTPGMISSVRGRAEMALVRGRLIPVIRLHRSFAVQPRSLDPCEGVMIELESEGRTFCLLVDELVGKQEVVIKSLGELLKNTPGVAGGAILGDGRVGLVLDVDAVCGSRADA